MTRLLAPLIEHARHQRTYDTGTGLGSVAPSQVAALMLGGRIAGNEGGKGSVGNGVADDVEGEHGKVPELVAKEGEAHHAQGQEEVAEGQHHVFA